MTDYLVYAAIDVGTTFSGYAYLGHKENPDSVHVSVWQSSKDQSTGKTPTALLLNEDGTLRSFGYDAIEQYGKLLDEDAKDYYFFRRFKLQLYQAVLSRETKCLDENERSLPVIQVFKTTIEFLKDHLLRNLKESFWSAEGQEGSILWILTLPSIWPDAAKQLMREAAVEAGIADSDIRLVLEPDAASMFCKIEFEQQGGFTIGQQYVVIDLGGGTVDISAHEILKDGVLRELLHTRGGLCGGAFVNQAFESFLEEITGDDRYMEFQKHRGFVNIDQAFEEGKKNIHDDANMCLKIPSDLANLFDDRYNDIKKKAEGLADTRVVRDKLLIEPKRELGFFQKPINALCQLLTRVFQDVRKGSIIFFVGGFSKSKVIRDSIEQQFETKNLKWCYPQSPDSVVLKGAVLVGIGNQTNSKYPTPVIERRARYTYGVEISEPFNKKKHQETVKFERDGKPFARMVFHRIIKKNEILTKDKAYVVQMSTQFKGDDKAGARLQSLTTALYISTEDDPKTCTAVGCKRIAVIRRDPPRDGWPEKTEATVEIHVGDAEWRVTVNEASTGRGQFSATLDYLT